MTPRSKRDGPAGGNARKERVARRYDKWSRWYDAVDASGGKAQERWRRMAVEALDIQPDELVVDLGTGTGAILPWILEGSAVTIAVDISHRMLVKARDRAPGSIAVLGDLERLPFRDGSVPKVIATFTLTTVPDPDAFVREAARILAPGGTFALLDTGPPKKKAYGPVHALMTGAAMVSGYTHIDRKPEAILAKVPELAVESERRMYGSMVYLYKLKKKG
ncbi:MAG: methyltransferase domain-containing protein [Methanobacteriota archaeon]